MRTNNNRRRELLLLPMIFGGMLLDSTGIAQLVAVLLVLIPALAFIALYFGGEDEENNGSIARATNYTPEMCLDIETRTDMYEYV